MPSQCAFCPHHIPWKKYTFASSAAAAVTGEAACAVIGPPSRLRLAHVRACDVARRETLG
eukprot:scaffold13040_cov69-Phaeocystis_antarctica.AAC.1